MKKSGIFTFSVRDIAEIAVLCALAVLLDTFVSITIGADGGSINICTVPLFIIAYRHGWFKGFIASGIVFGLITCLIDGYGFYTYPFDYLIAFGVIGVAGLFGKMINNFYKKGTITSKLIAIALVVATVAIWFVGRTLSSSVNSVLFYETSYWGGITYTMTYLPLTALFVAIVLALLTPVIVSLNDQYPTAYLKANKQEVDAE